MIKKELIEEIANAMAECADIDDLVAYFVDGQITYLEGLDKNELEEWAEQYGIDTE